MAIYGWFSRQKWWSSIAMLNYQRVTINNCDLMEFEQHKMVIFHGIYLLAIWHSHGKADPFVDDLPILNGVVQWLLLNYRNVNANEIIVHITICPAHPNIIIDCMYIYTGRTPNRIYWVTTLKAPASHVLTVLAGDILLLMGQKTLARVVFNWIESWLLEYGNHICTYIYICIYICKGL